MARRYETLDGLRGIAALSVAVGHITWSNAIKEYGPFGSTGLWVDFFFVLSGFVISHTYYDKLSSFSSLFVFMRKRFARIYPLHLTMLIVALGYETLKLLVNRYTSFSTEVPFDDNNIFSFISNLFLVHSLGIFPGGSWNGPSWSISVEFYTYLIFGIVVLLAGRRDKVAALLGAILVAFSYFVVVAFNKGDYLGVEYDYGIFRCVIGFTLGVFVQRLLRAWPEAVTGQWGAKIARVVSLAVILLMVSIPHPNHKWITLFAPPLIAFYIFFEVSVEGGLIGRILDSRPIQWLGDHSYTVYMVHSVIVLAMANVVEIYGKLDLPYLHAFGEAAAVLYILIALVVSKFVRQWIELPAQKWINSAFANRRGQMAQRATG